MGVPGAWARAHFRICSQLLLVQTAPACSPTKDLREAAEFM